MQERWRGLYWARHSSVVSRSLHYILPAFFFFSASQNPGLPHLTLAQSYRFQSSLLQIFPSNSYLHRMKFITAPNPPNLQILILLCSYRGPESHRALTCNYTHSGQVLFTLKLTQCWLSSLRKNINNIQHQVLSASFI